MGFAWFIFTAVSIGSPLLPLVKFAKLFVMQPLKTTFFTGIK
jgi:hypothetical protein